jgi:very-short-patch-repair endonuclease
VIPLELQCAYAKVPQPVSEFKFHPTRRWRFDYAWPEQKLAVEIEGGAFTNGRHTRGAGFIKDMEKYNAAAAAGWRVLRYTPSQVASGMVLEQVERLLKAESRL